MNNILYKSRVVLIRIGKVLPFIYCAMIVATYAESALALALSDFVVYDNEIILHKPLSWLIGDYFEYDWTMLAILCIVSISVDTCLWNKAACLYLGVNLYEKSFFETNVYDNEVYYAVCAINITLALYLTLKGIRILINNK